MEGSSHWSFLAAITFLLPLFNYFLLVETGCPFQNPFWFVEKPMVVSVFDENGEMVPNKVRVTWGRMENFKCVDYFQVIIDYILKVELRIFTQCLKDTSPPNQIWNDSVQQFMLKTMSLISWVSRALRSKISFIYQMLPYTKCKNCNNYNSLEIEKSLRPS